tara:strand:- start:24952 stop:25188 length:237 start_codon:yes stop_codon:yes gene_type:complete
LLQFNIFFTTKPAGEGTGLGLSLSYDIVVKGHGGTLTIESKENDFTVFMIQLPTNNNLKIKYEKIYLNSVFYYRLLLH